MTRDEVLALKSGIWLELKWNDSPNSVALLVEDVAANESLGDISLYVYDPYFGEVTSRPIHTQIVRVVGTLEIPKIM